MVFLSSSSLCVMYILYDSFEPFVLPKQNYSFPFFTFFSRYVYHFCQFVFANPTSIKVSSNEGNHKQKLCVCQRKIVYNIMYPDTVHSHTCHQHYYYYKFIFHFFFATRIIIVACSISEKKLQCATTTTLEKNTKRYFMSFSTLRIRNIAKAE